MRFILTNELGRLARWLRLLGFDTVYFKTNNMGSLIIQTLLEDRFIITRRHKKIDDLEKRTLLLKSDNLKHQLKEIIEKLNLKIAEENMFKRCTLCNALLQETSKESIRQEVPEYVYKTQSQFFQCPHCQRVYWQGSHWGNAQRYLAEIGLKGSS